MASYNKILLRTCSAYLYLVILIIAFGFQVTYKLLQLYNGIYTFYSFKGC